MTLIVDPTVYDPPENKLKRGAIGRRKSKWFRKMVVLRNGHKRHQTILTDLGMFALALAGKAYVSSTTGLLGAPPESGADQGSST